MQDPQLDPNNQGPPDPAAEPGSLPPARRADHQVLRLARRVWSPTPIPRPTILPDLHQLSWPERTAEVLRFTGLRLEHWLSRGGWLREWLRFNLWIAVILTVVAILVIPPVTAILEGARDWTGLVSATIGNINAAVTKLPPIVLAIATAFLLIKFLQRRLLGRQQDQRSRRDDNDGYR
jgi:hypothetical protein